MQEETRQKIVLAAAAAAVVFGVAYFMFFNEHKTKVSDAGQSPPAAVSAPKTATTPTTAVAPKSVSAEPEKESVAEALSSEDGFSLYITERAERAWDKNPFKLDDAIARLFAAAGGPGKETFVYSGYIEMLGGKTMAVINDMEFKQGEQISDAGYNLTKITPSFVVIERKKDKAVYKVPFSE